MALPVPKDSLPSSEWPYLLALLRLALALALGLFVGLERQRRGKEAGLRPSPLPAARLPGGLLAPLDDYF